jgi:hypothetical protein
VRLVGVPELGGERVDPGVSAETRTGRKQPGRNATPSTRPAPANTLTTCPRGTPCTIAGSSLTNDRCTFGYGTMTCR